MEQAFKPQSYPCVIGCGNEGFTPAQGYYYDPKAPGKQRPLSEYYEKTAYYNVNAYNSSGESPYQCR